MSQSSHSAWNAGNYPGTLQMCSMCGEPTERCEEDSIYIEGFDDPVCMQCYMARENGEKE
ncbi:hypothetical protein [Carnimonas bestiolae]|uniref:hypothetical protein n=1 Tax=Carnimonas bestiolae TaxID=3402172 RepID=UPI003F4AB804